MEQSKVSPFKRKVSATRRFPPGCGRMPSTSTIQSSLQECKKKVPVSAIRDFPPRCGRNASQVSREHCLNDIDKFRAKKSNNAEYISSIEEVMNDTIGKSVKTSSKTNLQGLELKCHRVSKNVSNDEHFDNEIGKKSSKTKEKLDGESMEKFLTDSHLQEKGNIAKRGNEALMATSSCPWRQGTRTSKSGKQH